ncbi:MAG: copper resistance protein B [Alcanivoracaceae bacterium]|jgi:copper resistance protein B|nr:copper resistance protein B [Alcanivoracaceae bacterium]
MKIYPLISILSLSLVSNSLVAGMEDDPLLTMVKIEKLELQDAGNDEHKPVILDGSIWVGKDLHKVYIKTEVERVNGENEEAEIQLLYSRALYPFWDVQIGWRRDFEPKPDQNWLALGLQGLAPYMFEVDAVMFIGESGQVAARLDAEYEYMFTQRLVLSPEIEINAYSKNDAGRGIGSGIADLSAGLRLRYEIRREFAPYLGINWNRQFGNTADMTRATGEDSSDTQLVVGIRAWF